MLDYFLVSLGYVTNHISIMDDREVVNNSLRKSSEGGKKMREKLRSKVKNVLDQEKETESQEFDRQLLKYCNFNAICPERETRFLDFKWSK